MLQRIQSIFLLLAGVCMFLLFVFPFSLTVVTDPEDAPNIIFDVNSHMVIMLMCVVIGGISVISIFLYGNRTLQIKVGWLNIILTLLFLGLVYFFSTQHIPRVDLFKSMFIGLFLPILSIILTMVANMSIKKDEKLVRSADRLR